MALQTANSHFRVENFKEQEENGILKSSVAVGFLKSKFVALQAHMSVSLI